MSHQSLLLLGLAMGLVFARTPLWAEEALPQVLPTRDTDVSYHITRVGQPPIIERRRWSASERLQQVDGPDNSSTIFDRNKGEFTLLSRKARTYRKFEGSPRMPMAPEKGRH